jgi:hypothetical protein
MRGFDLSLLDRPSTEQIHIPVIFSQMNMDTVGYCAIAWVKLSLRSGLLYILNVMCFSCFNTMADNDQHTMMNAKCMHVYIIWFDCWTYNHGTSMQMNTIVGLYM